MRSYIRSMMLGVAALLVVAPATAAVVSYTNNILTVLTENAGSSAGMFWVKTGSAHPNPNQNVIYDSETSYITLRDVTASEIWTNAGGTPNTNIPGFVSRSMQVAPATAAVTALPTGFRMTYTLPNWVVVQDVVVSGTTLADTNVRQSVTVTNTSAVSRSYGVRYMWDWEIANFLKNKGVATIAPYNLEQARTLCAGLAVVQQPSDARQWQPVGSALRMCRSGKPWKLNSR